MWVYDEQWVNNVASPVFFSLYALTGRKFGDDPASGAWFGRLFADIWTGPQLSPQSSLIKHGNECADQLGVPRPFPFSPTREDVCNVHVGFQGLIVHTKQYGDIRAWGPECFWLNDEDLISYCQQVKAARFSHVECTVSGRYDEPDFDYPVPGVDFTSNLRELRRRIGLAIGQGLCIKMSLAMDGRSRPPNPDGTYPYNDPQGWTYGFEWGMSNLPNLLAPFADVQEFVALVPAYDACFYGWDNLDTEPNPPDGMPGRVKAFLDAVRAIWPNARVGVEHTVGNIPTGLGPRDWEPGGTMENCDFLLSEFTPGNLSTDSTWQVIARCNPGGYIRPSDQPEGDDPHPVLYLIPCARGPRLYSRYEYSTVDWVRGRISVEGVVSKRTYLQSMGPGVVC